MIPTVSVVMPVYNGGKFLREAIDSVLQQSLANLEFVIVDDGSVDNTASLVQSYTDRRICFLQNSENLGIVETLNKGLARAGGKYIARMDADDVALPNRLEIQVAYLESQTAIGMIGSNVCLIDDAGNELEVERYPQHDELIRRTMFVHNPFAHSTVMIRRSVLDAVGIYDKRFRHNEDYDLWLRIAARYRVANLPDVLLKRRIHVESITSAHKTALARFRTKTLYNAIVHYYKNPLLMVHLIRPATAFLYRRTTDAFTS